MEIDHRLIQEYVYAVLEWYELFPEFEFERPYGRVDVVAFKRSEGKPSIGVEVSVTSEISKDAKKLVEFEMPFIVVTDSKREITNIAVKDKEVPVVYYEKFEDKVREALNLGEDSKRFLPFYEWANRRSGKITPIFTHKIDELSNFKNSLKDYGLEEFADDAIDVLEFLYIAREIPEEEAKYLAGGNWCVERTGYIPPAISSILNAYSLKNLPSGRGTGEQRKYFTWLTERGEALAKLSISKRIEDLSDELDEIISKYDKIGYIAIGSDLTFRKVKEEPESVIERVWFDAGMSEKYPESYGRGPDLFYAFCHFLARTAFYDEAIGLFEDLRKLKLAVEAPVYDSRARCIWMEYKIPEELYNYILQKCIVHVDDESLNRFGALGTLLNVGSIGDPSISKERLGEALGHFGIPVSYIEEELVAMNKEHITSKLMPDQAEGPFIILEPKKFKEYLISRLTETMNRAIS
jgi:hypothetical protein